MSSVLERDINGFWKDCQSGVYEVTFRVSGQISKKIMASSLEKARLKAENMAEDEEFGLELDEADDVSVSYLRKSPAMYLVKRDGKNIRVIHVMAFDEPREPDENGF